MFFNFRTESVLQANSYTTCIGCALQGWFTTRIPEKVVYQRTEEGQVMQNCVIKRGRWSHYYPSRFAFNGLHFPPLLSIPLRLLAVSTNLKSLLPHLFAVFLSCFWLLPCRASVIFLFFCFAFLPLFLGWPRILSNCNRLQCLCFHCIRWRESAGPSGSRSQGISSCLRHWWWTLYFVSSKLWARRLNPGFRYQT